MAGISGAGEGGLGRFLFGLQLCCLCTCLWLGVPGALAASSNGDAPEEQRTLDAYDRMQQLQKDPRTLELLQKLREAGQQMQKDPGLRDVLTKALKSAHAVSAPCQMGTILADGTTFYFFSGVLMFAESEDAESTLQGNAPKISRRLYELFYPEYERFVVEGGLDHLKDPSRQLDREQFAKVSEMQRRFYVRLGNSVGGKQEIIAKLRELVPEGVLRDVSFKSRVALQPPQGCETYRPAG